MFELIAVLLAADGDVSRGTVFVKQSLLQDGGANWRVDGSSNLQPIEDYESQIVRTGLYHGRAATVVDVLGRRSLGWDSSTAQGDCAQYLDTTQHELNAVSTATTYFLRSSSAADAAAGTGAQTVRIVSLNAAGVQQVTTVAMNGTTGVSLGAGFLYFQWLEVESVGSGGAPAGNITIASVAGAPTTAQTVEYMAVGETRSLSARYRVPAISTAFLVEWHLTAVGGATYDARIKANVFMNDRSASTVSHPQDSAYVEALSSTRAPLPWLSMPTGTELKIAAIPSATGAANRLNCHFRLVLVAN